MRRRVADLMRRSKHCRMSLILCAICTMLPAAAQSQDTTCNSVPIPNTGVMTGGASAGTVCISATDALGGNNPQMPFLFYGGGQPAGCTVTYSGEVYWSQFYSNPVTSSGGYYQSPALAGNVPWIVDWGQNLFNPTNYSEGGHGWLRRSKF